MDDKEYWGRLRSIVREEIEAALKVKPLTEESWESTEALCKKLDISKQTLYNWKKGAATAELMAANYRKLGGKVQWNYAGMMELLKSHSQLFGSGREYGYKQTEAQRLKGIAGVANLQKLLGGEQGQE